MGLVRYPEHPVYLSTWSIRAGFGLQLPAEDEVECPRCDVASTSSPEAMVLVGSAQMRLYRS